MTPPSSDLRASVTLERILSAYGRVEPHVRRTPLERSSRLSRAAGTDVYLKLECLQRTGSFKLRGALNAVDLLPKGKGGRGVVTASAGNHGLGLALAARLAGIPATIFLPQDAAPVKRERIRRAGAHIVSVAGGYDAAHAEAVRHTDASGSPYVHAYDDPAVVAGQGTVALEILRSLPDVRTVVVPVGGGGLVGGVGVAMRALAPEVRVIGVQSEATAAMHASLKAGILRAGPDAPTLCDGLAGDVSEATLTLAKEVVDEMVLVPEAEVARAMERLHYEEGLSVEGSAAVGPAALWSGAVRAPAGPVAVVVTGGNVDTATLRRVLAESVEGVEIE